jgi:hypothetical protein
MFEYHQSKAGKWLANCMNFNELKTLQLYTLTLPKLSRDPKLVWKAKKMFASGAFFAQTTWLDKNFNLIFQPFLDRPSLTSLVSKSVQATVCARDHGFHKVKNAPRQTQTCPQ